MKTALNLIGLTVVISLSFVSTDQVFYKNYYDLKVKSTATTDTTINPCRQFKKHKTAEAYFQSANNRTKGCPDDSLTTVVAAKEYGFAVKLNPKYIQARRNYARQLIKLKQYDHAIEQLNEAIRLTSFEIDSYLYGMRGRAYYEKGNYLGAIKDFDTAMKNVASIDCYLLSKAKAQWKLGLKDKACVNYRKAVAGTSNLAEEREFIECD